MTGFMHVSNHPVFQFNPARLSFAGAFLLFVSGCGMFQGMKEPRAQVDSPIDFSSDGLEFKYPGNWTAEVLGPGHVLLDTPGYAVFTISVMPEETAGDLPSFVKEARKGMQEALPHSASMETMPLGDARKTAVGEGLSVSGNFKVSVMGAPVLHWCRYYRLKIGDKVLFLSVQVPMEDLSMAQPGFDLVLGSLNINSSSTNPGRVMIYQKDEANN